MKIKQIYFVMLMSLYSSQLFCAFSTSPLQSNLQSIDIEPIMQLSHKLTVYAEHDEHMQELQGVLSTQLQQIEKYNNYVDNYQQLTQEQQKSLSDASFQDLIKVSKIELDSLSELSNVLMQSKNIDPLWQIKKYGMVLGSLSFVKNLVLPQNWTSCFYAGGGALTGLVASKYLPITSTTININIPVGVENVKISDDIQQKLMTTVAACALGAGTVIAASQLYTSWIHEKNSRDLLTDKIKAIRLTNSSIGQTFNTLGLHNAILRVEAIQSRQEAKLDRIDLGVEVLNDDRVVNTTRYVRLQNDVSFIKNNVLAVTELVQRIDSKLDNLVVAFNLNKQEAQGLKEFLESFKGDSQQAIQLLQKDFGEIKGLVMATAMLQMTIHQENKENFHAMHTNMESLQQKQPLKPFKFHNQMSAGQFRQQFPSLISSMNMNYQTGLTANASGEKASTDVSRIAEVD